MTQLLHSDCCNRIFANGGIEHGASGPGGGKSAHIPLEHFVCRQNAQAGQHVCYSRIHGRLRHNPAGCHHVMIAGTYEKSLRKEMIKMGFGIIRPSYMPPRHNRLSYFLAAFTRLIPRSAARSTALAIAL
jgi:hypothetical protein